MVPKLIFAEYYFIPFSGSAAIEFYMTYKYILITKLAATLVNFPVRQPTLTVNSEPTHTHAHT